jgi:hypothetical protein
MTPAMRPSDLSRAWTVESADVEQPSKADPDGSWRGAPMYWWRWGRVELPVQNPSPETTTSVSDDLSSTARTGIGTLPDGPVTCP